MSYAHGLLSNLSDVTEATSTTSERSLNNLMRFSLWYEHYHGYVSVVVCVVGVVFSTFNMAVLTRKHMLSITNSILTALAFSDMLTMLSYIPFALQFYCLHGTRPSPQRNAHGWVWFSLFHVNFTVVTHTTSIWLGVILAAFRYVHVRFSSTAAIYFTYQRTKWAILAVYIASAIVLIPNYLCLSVVSAPHRKTNLTMYHISAISERHTYGLVISRMNFWLHAVIIKILPCLLMSIFACLLLCTMRTSHKEAVRLRKKSMGVQAVRTRRREHSRTTAMLIAVLVLFLLTELPQGILALASGLNSDFFDAVYVPLGDVMDIVALLNNSINFMLYCVMSRQFRETFLWLLCPGRRLPKQCVTNSSHHHQVSYNSKTVIHTNNTFTSMIASKSSY